MNEAKSTGTTWLLISGLVLIVAGIISIVSPAVAGKAVVMVIGGIMLLTGALQMFQGFRSEGWSRKIGPLILGALILLGGLAVIAHPILGLTTLSLVLAIVFVVEGIWKIVNSFSYRPAAGWVAMLISGVLGLVLGWFIWSQWPLSGLWAVGVLVGVDLLATGIALTAIALTLKHLKRAIQDSMAT